MSANELCTGSAWNVEDDPTRPFLDFDIHSDLKIPLGFTKWLERLGVGYASYDVLLPDDSPLEVPVDGKGAYVSGTALLRLKLRDDAEPTLNSKYPFTIRLFGADGTSKDDATLYLRLVQK